MAHDLGTRKSETGSASCYPKSAVLTQTQFLITMTMAPVMSLVIVLAGYIVQNNNLNARMADLRSEMKDLLHAQMEAMRAEITAVRAEMARNHSELLMKFADLDRRIGHLEARQ